MATTSDAVRPSGGPERPEGLPERYRLDARLGSGRRRLYRAWDDVLCRPVVVELVAARAGRPAVAGLHHPGLTALYDVGTCAGGHFLVTQFVDGPSLADRATRRALSAPAVLAAGTRLAEALAYLHAHGVTHGAVGPATVRFDRTGEAHLLGRVHRPPDAEHGTSAFGARASADVARLARMLRRCLRRHGSTPWAWTAEVAAPTAALLAHAAAPRSGDRPTAGRLAAGLAQACGVERPGPGPPARAVAHRRVAVVALLGVVGAVVVGRPAFGAGGPVAAEAPAAPATAVAGARAGVPSDGVLASLPAPPVVLSVLAETAASAQAQAARIARAARQVPRPPLPPAGPVAGHDDEDARDGNWDADRHDGWDDRSWRDRHDAGYGGAHHAGDGPWS